MEHTFRHLLQLSNEFAQEKEKLPPCPLYYINLFDKYHAVENDTSWALCEIFNYTEDGAYILFKLFAAKYLKPLGFDTDNIGQPFIKNEEYNIDLFISEQNYAIIFENKIKDAVFQRNQLGKYIARLIDSGYREEQIYLVVLPRHYTPSYIEEMRPSVWKSPKDWKTPNQCRACRHKDLYQCWCDDSSHALTPQEVAEHCQKCKDHKQAFYSRTVILDHTFADWLQDVLLAAVPADQYLVKSVIVQMADYLKGLFQTRLKDQPLMEMQEFLQKELLPSETNNLENWALLDKKLRQLKDLTKAMEDLKKSISKNLIDEWREKLLSEWPNLSFEPNKSFGLQIEGVWCGCWSGSCPGEQYNNGQPYWGFYCSTEPTPHQMGIVKNLLEAIECESVKAVQKGGFIAYRDLCQGECGDEICRRLYEAAKHLGYF